MREGAGQWALSITSRLASQRTKACGVWGLFCFVILFHLNFFPRHILPLPVLSSLPLAEASSRTLHPTGRGRGRARASTALAEEEGGRLGARGMGGQPAAGTPLPAAPTGRSGAAAGSSVVRPGEQALF